MGAKIKRFMLHTWLLGWLLFCCGLVHAQGNMEDIPLPDDPPPPALATPAPSGGGNAEDIPLPDDPAVPGGETPAAIEEEPEPAPVSHATADFMRPAFYAGVVVAAMCAYLGLFVVARRMVFVGLALSELSSAGIALGVFLGFERGAAPLLFSLAFMLLGVMLFSRRWAPRRVPHEAVIGGFYCMATALGILLVAKSSKGETHMLKLLQGDILAVYPAETMEMAGIFVGLAIMHALFAKEFLLVSLDHDTASTMGFRAQLWDFLLFLSIGITVSLSIRSVGVLLTTALLILPAATALLVVPRWNLAALVAPLVGIVAVGIGLWLSLAADFPASAVTVAVLFAIFFPTLLWNSLRRS